MTWESSWIYDLFHVVVVETTRSLVFPIMSLLTDSVFPPSLILLEYSKAGGLFVYCLFLLFLSGD